MVQIIVEFLPAADCKNAQLINRLWNHYVKVYQSALYPRIGITNEQLIELFEQRHSLRYINLRSLDSMSAKVWDTLANCEKMEGLAVPSSCTDISFLTLLPKLKSLDLWATNNITDYSPVGSCANLETLTVPRLCTDISFLTQLFKLKSLNLKDCDNITDYSPVGSCANLEKLILPSSCTDISFLTLL